MTTYAWLGETPSAFELRLKPNLRTFTGPYGPVTQVVDLQGERWQGQISLPPLTDPVAIAAREAWLDRLKGQANTFAIWHFGQPSSGMGTIGATRTVSWVDGGVGAVSWVDGTVGAVSWVDGAPVLAAPVVQGANTATIQALPGVTAKAGRMLGLPGQTVRLMADATADAAGQMPIEFQPRARAAMAGGGAVTVTRPTIVVMMRSADGVPTTMQPGYADGCTFEFIEVPQ